MTNLLLSAAFIGFIDGVTPGPIVTILCIDTFRGGLLNGARTLMISALFELLVAGATVVLILSLPIPHSWFYVLGIFGGMLLLWFAKTTMSIQKFESTSSSMQGASIGQIFLLTISNPMLYVVYLTIYVPHMKYAESLVEQGDWLYFWTVEYSVLCGGIVILLSSYCAKQLIHNEAVVHRVYQMFGLLLAFFGCKMLFDSSVILFLS